MGLIDSLFGMGHKKNKHKKKSKSSQHQQARNNNHNNRSANNGKHHKVVHRVSRKENVFEVAEDVFGGKYFCAGDDGPLG